MNLELSRDPSVILCMNISFVKFNRGREQLQDFQGVFNPP